MVVNSIYFFLNDAMRCYEASLFDTLFLTYYTNVQQTLNNSKSHSIIPKSEQKMFILCHATQLFIKICTLKCVIFKTLTNANVCVYTERININLQINVTIRGILKFTSRVERFKHHLMHNFKFYPSACFYSAKLKQTDQEQEGPLLPFQRVCETQPGR